MLLKKMRSGTSMAESTLALKSAVARQNRMFAGYAQHDGQEFLKSLLEGIHDDVNRIVGKPQNKELKAPPDQD